MDKSDKKIAKADDRKVVLPASCAERLQLPQFTSFTKSSAHTIIFNIITRKNKKNFKKQAIRPIKPNETNLSGYQKLLEGKIKQNKRCLIPRRALRKSPLSLKKRRKYSDNGRKRLQIQRLQIPITSPDFHQDENTPSTSIASTKPIPNLDRHFLRNNILIDGERLYEWLVELNTPVNSLEINPTTTQRMLSINIPNMNRSSERIGYRLKPELEYLKSKARYTENETQLNLISSIKNYIQIDIDKFKNCNEEVITNNDNSLNNQATVIIRTAEDNARRPRMTDKGVEPIVLHKSDNCKYIQFPSMSESLPEKHAEPSYVACYSEVLEKTTNFEGNESPSTQSSIIGTDCVLRDDILSHLTIEAADCSFEDRSSLFWCAHTCKTESCFTLTKSGDANTVSPGSYNSSCGDRNVQSSIMDFDNHVYLDKHGRESMKHYKYYTSSARFPSDKYKLIRPQRKGIFSRICRRRLNCAWKKTTARWINYPKHHRRSSRMLLPERLLELIKSSMVWEDVHVQTMTLVYHEKGTTYTNLVRRMSKGTSFFGETSVINNGESGYPRAKLQHQKSQLGSTKFPFFYYTMRHSMPAPEIEGSPNLVKQHSSLPEKGDVNKESKLPSNEVEQTPSEDKQPPDQDASKNLKDQSREFINPLEGQLGKKKVKHKVRLMFKKYWSRNSNKKKGSREKYKPTANEPVAETLAPSLPKEPTAIAEPMVIPEPTATAKSSAQIVHSYACSHVEDMIAGRADDNIHTKSSSKEHLKKISKCCATDDTLCATNKRSVYVLTTVEQKSHTTVTSFYQKSPTEDIATDMSGKNIFLQLENIGTNTNKGEVMMVTQSTSDLFLKQSTNKPISMIDTWAQYNEFYQNDENSYHGPSIGLSKLMTTRLLNDSTCEITTQAEPVRINTETDICLSQEFLQVKSACIMTSALINESFNTGSKTNDYPASCSCSQSNKNNGTDVPLNLKEIKSVKCSACTFMPSKNMITGSNTPLPKLCEEAACAHLELGTADTDVDNIQGDDPTDIKEEVSLVYQSQSPHKNNQISDGVTDIVEEGSLMEGQSPQENERISNDKLYVKEEVLICQSQNKNEYLSYDAPDVKEEVLIINEYESPHKNEKTSDYAPDIKEDVPLIYRSESPHENEQFSIGAHEEEVSLTVQSQSLHKNEELSNHKPDIKEEVSLVYESQNEQNKDKQSNDGAPDVDEEVSSEDQCQCPHTSGEINDGAPDVDEEVSSENQCQSPHTSEQISNSKPDIGEKVSLVYQSQNEHNNNEQLSDGASDETSSMDQTQSPHKNELISDDKSDIREEVSLVYQSQSSHKNEQISDGVADDLEGASLIEQCHSLQDNEQTSNLEPDIKEEASLTDQNQSLHKIEQFSTELITNTEVNASISDEGPDNPLIDTENSKEIGLISMVPLLSKIVSPDQHSTGLFLPNDTDDTKKESSTDKDYQTILDMEQTNLDVLKQATFSLENHHKTSMLSSIKKSCKSEPTTKIMNMNTLTVETVPFVSDDSLADVLPVKPMNGKQTTKPNNMIDKNTSGTDERITKEVKECNLQTCFEVTNTAIGTFPSRHTSKLCKSSSSLTCKYVPHSPELRSVSKSSSPSGIYEYIANHKKHVPMTQHVPISYIAVHSGQGMILDVISPKVYKALHETTKVVFDDIHFQPVKNKRVNTSKEANFLTRNVTKQSAAIMTLPNKNHCSNEGCCKQANMDLTDLKEDEEQFCSLFVNSCKHYGRLLTKHFGCIKEKVTKHLVHPDDYTNGSSIHKETSVYREMCTMKPSGRDVQGCQTLKIRKNRYKTASKLNLALSCCTITPSRTNICNDSDKNELKSIYHILSAIEGRVRRLKRHVAR